MQIIQKPVLRFNFKKMWFLVKWESYRLFDEHQDHDRQKSGFTTIFILRFDEIGSPKRDVPQRTEKKGKENVAHVKRC